MGEAASAMAILSAGQGGQSSQSGMETAAVPPPLPSPQLQVVPQQHILVVDGVCNFTPAAPRRIRATTTEGSCELCDTERQA